MTGDGLDTAVAETAERACALVRAVAGLAVAWKHDGIPADPEAAVAMRAVQRALVLCAAWGGGDYGPGREETAREIRLLVEEAIMLCAMVTTRAGAE